MLLELKSKYRADLRVHKTYEFLENFYQKEYPRKLRIFVVIIVILFLGNIWQILK